VYKINAIQNCTSTKYDEQLGQKRRFAYFFIMKRSILRSKTTIVGTLSWKKNILDLRRNFSTLEEFLEGKKNIEMYILTIKLKKPFQILTKRKINCTLFDKKKIKI